MTPKPISEIDPLDLVVEEFVERLRRGERPPIEEYARRHPDVADRIRELFPALAAVEGAAAVLTSDGSASAITEVESSPLPERIGDYRILREVGRGGMGVVYEAEQESLGRHVALKVLLPEYQTRARFLARFRREARAAGRLHHTNIVPVFGVGESDGRHYLVMQYIAGVGLDQVIRDVRRLRRDVGDAVELSPPTAGETLSVSVAHGLMHDRPPAPPNRVANSSPLTADTSQLVRDGGYLRAAARLALQAARALDHAHAHGIVHRDVKPSNFLLDDQSNLWVTDFGLAKTEESSDLTGSHDILGTMRYMSPERFAGDSIDARADVYSLGLTLYEMLCLRPAFAEYDRIQLMQLIARGDFRRPREVDPTIPRDLETIVLKATAREPKDRYRTARDLGDDLELFLANRPIRSRRASYWEHLCRWARRNPVVAGLAGTVVLLLVAVTTISLVSNARLGRTNKDLDARTTELGDALEEQGKLREKAQAEAWHARIEATRSGRFSGRRGQRIDGLENLKRALELAPGRSLNEVRNEVVGCLALPDSEVIQEVPWPYGTTSVTFTHDLSKYARIDTAGRVSVRRVADDRELFELPHGGLLSGYFGWRFSPDGRYLWHWTKPDTKKDLLTVWQVDGAAPAEVLSLSEHSITGLDFLADSSHIAVVDRAGTLRVYALGGMGAAASMMPVHEARFSTDTARTVWAHPNLTDTVLLAGETKWCVYDISQPDQVLSRPIPENAGVSWLAWHPDGRHFALAGEHVRRIYLCSTESGSVVTTLDGHTKNGILVWFDPAGDRLWSTDWTGHVRMWNWQAGQQLFQMLGPTTIPPTITADGSLAGISRGDRMQIFRVEAGREAARLAIPSYIPIGKSGLVGTPVVSPDGRLAAAPCEDLIAIFDLHRRELAGTIPMDRGMPIRFEADSSALLINARYAGRYGLYRVSLARTGSQLRIGHLELVRPFGRFADLFGLSDDGRVLAVPLHDLGADLYRDGGQNPTRLGSQRDVRFCTVSPGGEWVITGSHGEGTVVLWNALTGERVQELESWGGHSAFSRDGRWASTYRSDTSQARIWDTRTWQPGPAVPGQRGVFSPDGKFLALEGEAGVIRLVRVPDCEEVVRLTVPDNFQFVPGFFTADGGTLAAMAVGAGFVQVWDLHAIRRQLRPMGLDWDDTPVPEAPPTPFRYPPALTVTGSPPEPKSSASEPAVIADPKARSILNTLVIAQHPLHPAGYIRRAEDLISLNRFDDALRDAEMAIRLAPETSGGHRVRGRIHRAAGDLSAALRDFQRAAELDPDSRSAHAECANTALALRDDVTFLASAQRMIQLSPEAASWWQGLATTLLVAEPSRRDVPRALEAATTSVRLTPSNPYARTVLGYALLESNRIEEAAREFAESRKSRPAMPYDAQNLFGLAICSQRAGQSAQARAWFAQAIAGKDSGRFQSELASRLHWRMYAEAAKALDLPPPFHGK